MQRGGWRCLLTAVTRRSTGLLCQKNGKGALLQMGPCLCDSSGYVQRGKIFSPQAWGRGRGHGLQLAGMRSSRLREGAGADGDSQPSLGSLCARHKCQAGVFREEEEDKATYYPLPSLHLFTHCSFRQG